MTVTPNLYVWVSLQQLIQLHIGGGHASLGSSGDDLLQQIVELSENGKKFANFGKSDESVLEGKI